MNGYFIKFGLGVQFLCSSFLLFTVLNVALGVDIEMLELSFLLLSKKFSSHLLDESDSEISFLPTLSQVLEQRAKTLEFVSFMSLKKTMNMELTSKEELNQVKF